MSPLVVVVVDEDEGVVAVAHPGVGVVDVLEVVEVVGSGKGNETKLKCLVCKESIGFDYRQSMASRKRHWKMVVIDSLDLTNGIHS